MFLPAAPSLRPDDPNLSVSQVVACPRPTSSRRAIGLFLRLAELCATLVVFPTVVPDTAVAPPQVASVAAVEAPAAAPPVAVTRPASQQAQVQVDANGQPFILVNGQKFLLQAAAPVAD
ncbi:hypothetical protein [Roseibium algae]|uniref:Uncharacterized protein n=1 Tax=Roseibium algae TaxID=3123038 RepID=A0ABU8TKG5_9HYPH